MHRQIEPAILYLGTPVVLVSTLNEDGTANLSPMSSAWWLGWSCMLGLDASSKTTVNLLRTKQCVLNLPSANEVKHVDPLARLTGSDPMPKHKKHMGYRFEPDKFGTAGVTPEPSLEVDPPRVKECPIQLEAVLVASNPFATDDPRMHIPMLSIEVRITKVHADEAVLSEMYENRIDPNKWNPLLMSFLNFYERGSNVHHSRLGEIPEEHYDARRPTLREAATSDAD